MRIKITIMILAICLALLPVFQIQGQINPKPEILDMTQGYPSTGENFTIDFCVSDTDGVDIVQIYVYFRIFDGISTPEYPAVTETSPDIFQSTLNVPVNASVMHYNIRASDDRGSWNNTNVLNRDVEDNIEPLAVVQPSANTALGTPYRFNGSSSQDNIGIVYYNWSFVHDGMAIALNGMEPIFNFTKYGTYAVTLTVTDADGNWDTTSITVSTNDGISPVADFWIEPIGYVGQFVDFDGSSSTDNVGIVEYSWTFYHNGTLVTLNGQNLEFRFWEAREYNVTLTVTDAAGNSDQNSFVVHVLHDNLIEPSELPWWAIGLVLMILLVIITTVFIFRTSKN